MEWRKDDAFGRTISTKQRSQLPPPRIYHLRLLSTPGRETFCVVWIEFGIWLVDYALGPSNRPWSCLHIIRLIGLAHIPWPTCGILLKMWSTMHELAFGVQQEEITDLKWPPSPSYWGWGDVIFSWSNGAVSKSVDLGDDAAPSAIDDGLGSQYERKCHDVQSVSRLVDEYFGFRVHYSMSQWLHVSYIPQSRDKGEPSECWNFFRKCLIRTINTK